MAVPTKILGKVDAFVELVSARSNVFSSSAVFDQYMESLRDIAGWANARLEFCTASYAHPTALSALIDRVTVPTERSTEAEWFYAHKMAIAFAVIAASALICERLLQGDNVLALMAACCDNSELRRLTL